MTIFNGEMKMKTKTNFDENGMYEEVEWDMPSVFGAKPNEDCYSRYKEYRKWFTVMDRNSLFECYGIVMEQCHQFDMKLESVFRMFRFNTKARSNKAWLDHIKEMYLGWEYLGKKDYELLYELLRREQLLKEYFFCADFVLNKDFDRISDFFYACYISFFDGKKRLTELTDAFLKKMGKAKK